MGELNIGSTPRKKIRLQIGTCRYCSTEIVFDGVGVWFDETDGDVCSGNDELVNENEPHVPDPDSIYWELAP